LEQQEVIDYSDMLGGVQ